MKEKWVVRVFVGLVFLSLLTPLWVFKDLLFPFITSKAFFLRIVVQLALPLYVYLLVTRKDLWPSLKNPLNISALVFLALALVSALVGIDPFKSLWGNFERMGGVFYLAHLTLLYFYVLMLGQMGDSDTKRVFSYPFMVVFGVVTGLLVSIFGKFSGGQGFGTVVGFAFYFSFIAWAGGSYLKRFLQAWVAVAIFVTLNGFSGWMGGPTLVQDPSLPYRVSSTFGNPIFFASYLILPMTAAIFLGLQEGRHWTRWPYFVSAFLMLLGIYSSGTRGSAVGILISVVVGALLYLVFTTQRKVKTYGWSVIGIFAVAIILLFLNSKKLPEGTTLYRLFNLRDSNTSARIIQWQTALRGYQDYPLFGVGPENYMVLSNRYFNPEMYKYDPSWFDKPHNFILEVLVTHGVVGLVAYLAMLLFGAAAVYYAFRQGFLSLVEACVLFGGFLAYQIQNLFVFDTVSASAAFYIFLGFTGYLWYEGKREQPVKQAESQMDKGYAYTVFGIAGVAVLYLLYISNIMPLRVAKYVNYGLAYGNASANSNLPKPHETAAEYFDKMKAMSFNIDPVESYSKYSEFAMNLVRSSVAQSDPEFVRTRVKDALESQRAVAEQAPYNAIAWQRVATLEWIWAAISSSNDFTVAQMAADKATELAPGRVDMLRLQAQLQLIRGNTQEALKYAEEMVRVNSTNPETKWFLAIVKHEAGDVQGAVASAEESLANGFKPGSPGEYSWLIDHYEQQGNNQRLLALFEQMTKQFPNDANLFLSLAKVHGRLGNADLARQIAHAVAQADSSKKAEVDEFLKTLQ